MHMRILLSRSKSAQHRTRTCRNTNDLMTIFPTTSFFAHPSTLVVFVRAGRGATVRRGTPLRSTSQRRTPKKCANASAAGRSCGGMLRRTGRGGRGWGNTQHEIAAAVESVYRVDLKRADPDLGLLGGDDGGGKGRGRAGRAPASRLCTTGRTSRRHSRIR